MTQELTKETEELINTLMSDLEHFKVSAQTLVSISKSKTLEIIKLEKQIKFYRDDIYKLNKLLQNYRDLYGDLNNEN